MSDLAKLNTSEVTLAVKFKDGTNTYNVSDGALTDELYSTAQAIDTLRDGETVGYYKIQTSQILPV